MKTKKAHVWPQASDDWYVEPSDVSFKLGCVEYFEGHIHDPCCGQGSVIRGLQPFGYDITGSDLRERVTIGTPWFLGASDFMDLNGFALYGAQNCIFNPPFFRAAGTEAFIRRALQVTPGKVCAFVDIRFLAGVRRANGLWSESAPDRVYIVTPRVSCPPGEYLAAGGKAGNGSADWIWLIWDERRGDTRVRWLT